MTDMLNVGAGPCQKLRMQFRCSDDLWGQVTELAVAQLRGGCRLKTEPVDMTEL
jgi:hypothetical protein